MKRIIAILIGLTITLNFCISTKADEIEEPRKIFVTAYIIQGTTASGTQTREGVCAMNRSLLGKTVIIYLMNDDGSVGDVYGIYEVEDTGATRGLKNGSVVDIWCPSMEDAKRVMADTKGVGFIQIIDAEG